MPKAPKGSLRPPRQDPLDVQLRNDASGELAPSRRRAAATQLPARSRPTDDGVDGDAFLSSKLSRKVLDEARAQQEDEDDDNADAVDGQKKRVKFRQQRTGAVDVAGGRSRRPSDVVRLRADHDDEDEDEDEEIVDFGAEDDVRLDGDYVDVRGDAGYEASAEDEAMLRRFMPESAAERRTLADIIMEKLAEAGAGASGSAGGGAVGGAAAAAAPGRVGLSLDPKVVEVYTEVGRFLSHYKSGSLPKVFKVIPALSEWETVLFLTSPETWTPHAAYAATRIFASNLNPAKAQRFFNLVLLPKCRDDVHAHGRLNFHLYLALKKATYKSAAFYKGILLPLAASGDCTLREAVIVGSVVAKTAIPQLHSAAALIKLATMPYSGAVSIFLRILVNKKYTLPYMAVDVLVDHFTRFSSVEGPLPVIWHQALLAFVQRYKADLLAEQKDRVRQLLHVHVHHAMTPEVRRELASAPCRGESGLGAAGPVGSAAAAAAGVPPPQAAVAGARRPSLQPAARRGTLGTSAAAGRRGGGCSGDALGDVDMI